MSQFNRRAFIKAAIAAAPASAFLAVPKAHAGNKASIVVVGGGFGGATAAKYLKMMDPALDVTLVECAEDLHRLPAVQRSHLRPRPYRRPAARLRRPRQARHQRHL
jgi:choline dehydrogenase-like flavoprotein